MLPTLDWLPALEVGAIGTTLLVAIYFFLKRTAEISQEHAKTIDSISDKHERTVDALSKDHKATIEKVSTDFSQTVRGTQERLLDFIKDRNQTP